MEVDISGYCVNPLVKLWRYDCDQTLKFRGMEVPDGTELQFYQDGHSSKTFVEDSAAAVPDCFFAKAIDVVAYLYIVGPNGGQTVRRITIIVQNRPKPTNYADPTPPTDYSRLLPPGGEDRDVLMFGPEGPCWGNLGSPGIIGEVHDYRLMENKPTIEDVVLEGNKTLEQLGATKITNQELEEIFNV